MPPYPVKGSADGATEALVAFLVSELESLKQHISKLESSLSLPAKPTPPFPPTHPNLLPRKGQLAAPNSTPTHCVTTNLPINSLSSKASFEKTLVTISVPDDQTGHIVGRAGAGLAQIHEFSHAKISVSPPTDSSGLRTITIRGSAREAGDALIAIGKRMARRRVRKPRPKREGSSSPPAPKALRPPTPLSLPSPPADKMLSPNMVRKSVPTAQENPPSPIVKLPVKMSAQGTPQEKKVFTPLAFLYPSSTLTATWFSHAS